MERCKICQKELSEKDTDETCALCKAKISCDVKPSDIAREQLVKAKEKEDAVYLIVNPIATRIMSRLNAEFSPKTDNGQWEDNMSDIVESVIRNELADYFWNK